MPLWMKTGTINVVNGSKNVVGVGTQFISSTIPARPGQPIVINNILWEIENVISNTSMTLAVNYTGATANGLAYTIMTTMEGSFNDLARRSAQVMGVYQQYMDIYNSLFTGSGFVQATLPDGSVVNLPSWNYTANLTLRKTGDTATGTMTIAPPAGTNPLDLVHTFLPATSNAQGVSGFSASNPGVRVWGAGAMAVNNEPSYAYFGFGSAPWNDGLRIYGPQDLRVGQGGVSYKIMHQQNMVGPVTQAGGKPTGAIIERGSTATGEYTKYADGSLECWGQVTIVYANASLMQVNWTLPVPHSGGLGVVVFTGYATDSGVRRLNRAVPAGASLVSGSGFVLLRLWATGTDSFVAGDSVVVNALFKGRWY